MNCTSAKSPLGLLKIIITVNTFKGFFKLRLILLFQALLLAIVGLSYYGNEGTRLFFGLLDYLGVGITVGFSIVIPLIFLSYLCDGNILIFVSGIHK